MQDRYRWQATKSDESILEVGDDLLGVVMVSLIPESPLFPRHDFTGLAFIRRFCRGFMNAINGGELREYVHCIVCEQCRIYIRSSNGSVLVTPPHYELYV